ncbi:MAG: hypothetical protein WB609_06175 [Candidatus Cybelea sp.]
MPKPTDDTELDAVQSILATLSRFDHNVRRKILRTVNAFFGADHGDDAAPLTLPSVSSKFFQQRPMSARQFSSGKQPKTAIERLVTLAYFLEESRGAHDYTAQDLISASKEAALPSRPSITSAIEKAKAEQLIAPNVLGRYHLTPTGRAYAEALPNRDRAQQLLIALPTLKQGKSRRKIRKRSN